MINFKLSKLESRRIQKIVERGLNLARESDIEYSHQDMEMDITACHCNGCPLDLDRFLAAALEDFRHDLFGIRRYIDRSTGKLEEIFHPRCAEPVCQTT